MKTRFSLVLVAALAASATASAADLSANVRFAADAESSRNEGTTDAAAKPARRAKTGTSAPTDRATAPAAAEKDVWAVPLFQNAKPLHAPR